MTNNRNKPATNVEPGGITKLQERLVELEGVASKLSAELEFNKNYDALTGLPNQILFQDRIGQVIERGTRFDQLAAVLVIDIDASNQVNSSLGQVSNDKLLTKIADRFKNNY